MVNDPVGDFIVRLTNAGAVRHETVVVPYTKHLHAIAETLVSAHYVRAVEKRGRKNEQLVVTLSYNTGGTPRIVGVRRLSKPGRRFYTKSRDAHRSALGGGIRIMTTPKGILTDSEARRDRAGGEVLFEIW